MLSNLLFKLLAAPLIFVLSHAGYNVSLQNNNLGSAATIPSVDANFSTTLASGIGTTDQSMTLVNGTNQSGTSLSGYKCFTLDANTASSEFVCGTAAGTSVTALNRGINVLNPNASSTAAALVHRRGATVVETNYPQIGIMSRLLNGDDTFPNILSYTSHPSFVSGTQIIDKTYADNLAFNGAATSTENTLGLVMLTDNSLLGTGQASSTSGAPLVLLNRKACNSFNAASSTCIVVTGAGNTIASNFISTSSQYTWSGLQSFTASTTLTSTTTIAATSANKLSLNSVPYVYPSSQAVASGTVETNDGNGKLSWNNQFFSLLNATTTSGNQSYATATISTTNSDLHFEIWNAGITSGSNNIWLRFNGDMLSNYAYSFLEGNNITTTSGTTSVMELNAGTTSQMYITGDITNLPLPARKLITWKGIAQSGGLNPPVVISGGGVWNGTTSLITSMTLGQGGNSGDHFLSGTFIKMYAKSDN